MKWMNMVYNGEDDRWEVLMPEVAYAMHCGVCFEMDLGDHQSRICRMEMDQDWYVVLGSTSFRLREKQTYRVAL